jgi:monoamine oxidase
LLEIHDASPSSTREGALFGFVGTPADQRHGESSEIIDSAIRQLTALFGPKAARTKNILFEDWRKRPLPPFHRINLRHSSIRFMAPCHTRMRPGMGGCSLLRPRPLRNSVGFLKGALVTAEQAALDVIASQP